MAAAWVVPAFYELEYRHPDLGFRLEATSLDQLALQGCEEGLTHGVVVGITYGAGGWADIGLSAVNSIGRRNSST